MLWLYLSIEDKLYNSSFFFFFFDCKNNNYMIIKTFPAIRQEIPTNMTKCSNGLWSSGAACLTEIMLINHDELSFIIKILPRVVSQRLSGNIISHFFKLVSENKILCFAYHQVHFCNNPIIMIIANGHWNDSFWQYDIRWPLTCNTFHRNSQPGLALFATILYRTPIWPLIST